MIPDEARAAGGSPGKRFHLMMAPLRGVTIRSFREVFSHHFTGVDSAIAPFIPTVAGDRIQAKLLKDVALTPDVFPNAVPQLIGKEPSQLTAMIRALRDLGHDEVNLNAGCPWKFVAKKGRGSGLLANPDGLRRMLDAGCDAIPGGFSVKVRLGLKDDDELLEARIALFNEYPLRHLIIHPRTAEQMYDGTVDIERFARILPMCRMHVVYNGDIFSVEDFVRLSERFPCIDTWMIGRGLVADPFLPAAIHAKVEDGKPLARSLEKIRDFHDELYGRAKAELFGPASILGRMKEAWGYLYRSVPGGMSSLRAIQRSRGLDDYERNVVRAFDGRGAECR